MYESEIGFSLVQSGVRQDYQPFDRNENKAITHDEWSQFDVQNSEEKDIQERVEQDHQIDDDGDEIMATRMVTLKWVDQCRCRRPT